MKSINLSDEETEAIYKIIKEYEKDYSEGEDEYYSDYYDEDKEPIEKKLVNSIIKKIISILDEKQKIEIDKDFLRQKYHTFNNDIDESIYEKIEKAFSDLKTIEIKYFNMESAEFIERKLDVYYKSRKYVIGYCHLRKEIRKFRTSRIASTKLTKDRYKIPKNFDKNNY